MSDHVETPGVSRRRVLRATAIGAAWAVPTVGILGVGTAHADTPSGTPPTTAPPTVEPTVEPSQPPTTTDEPTTPDTTTTTTGAVLPEQTAGSPRAPQAAPVRAAAPAAQGESLAFTGSETTTAATVAAGLVLGGAALTIASRTRSDGEGKGKHTA
jgi:hypothetical protein